jgi:hypothetical protein
MGDALRDELAGFLTRATSNGNPDTGVPGFDAHSLADAILASSAVARIRAEAKAEARAEMLKQAGRLHQPIREYASASTDPTHVSGYIMRCRHDGHLWPCTTIAMLSVSAPPEVE